jgi:hypothetical protein
MPLTVTKLKWSLSSVVLVILPRPEQAAADTVQYRNAVVTGRRPEIMPAVRRGHGFVVKRRSKMKSAEIVAGRAVAIGALSGGGKGAGIGAICGRSSRFRI